MGGASAGTHAQLVPVRRVVLLLAVATAVAGAVVNLWRPLAPPLLGTPTDLAAFGPDVLARIDAYRSSQRVVGLISLLVGTAVPVALLVWRPTRRWLVRLAGAGRPALRAGLVAAIVLAVADLLTLPFDVWVGWIHEREFGFAAGSLGLWLRDRVVSLVLGAGLVALGAALLWSLATRAPRTWDAWLVLFATVAAAVLVLLHPLVVQPLFLSTTPLDAGPVHDAVREVLTAAGEPELGIEVGDASTRTTRVNAFVTGLGPSRRVVLYDNLLELPTDQVAYVVAHELAHREHRDLPRSVLLTATAAFPIAWLIRRSWAHPRVQRALRANGDGGEARTDVTLLPALALAVLVVTSLVGSPIANAVSRRAEAAADHRALELTGEPAAQIALNRVFVTRDLADPVPPVWVTALWGSHPSVSRRIQAAVDHAARHDVVLPPVDELTAGES